MTKAPRFPLPLDRLHRGAPRVGADALLRPQRPLAQAAQDATRRAAPASVAQGLGLDSGQVRARMVARLHERGLGCEPVLRALAEVPRHCFVDSALATQAYEDTSLPIGFGQTISKPSVVARMLALLFDGSHARAAGTLGRTLEIGTGCGYQTALLALLATHVVSIERLQPLHEKARGHLAERRAQRVRLVFGDGTRGHAPNAPYDSIIAAAGGSALPPAWLEQLAVGGRLVAPVADAATGAQSLVVVDRSADGYTRRVHEGVHFVPLRSGTQGA
jgi:protein-L-isoaspartate(D-aspartate) O-methyltransferase